MDVTTVLLFTVVFLISCWCLHRRRRRHPRLPPGPRGWPIFGHISTFSGNPLLYKQLSAWRDVYGDVFSVYIGDHPAVVVSSPQLIREVLVKHADQTSQRPHWFHFYKTYKKSRGIIWNMHNWKNQRKCVLTALKDFGLGSTSLEQQVNREAATLCQSLHQNLSEPVNLQLPLSHAVSNIICNVVFGRRFAYDDDVFIEMVERNTFNFAANLSYCPPNFIPWTLPFFKLLNTKRFGQARKNREFFDGFIQAQIREHQATYDVTNIRDVIDVLIEMEESGKTKYGGEALICMSRVVLDLFSAGTETTSTTLLWCILYLLHYPDVQTRCREEILQVIGNDREPTMVDRESLPYTEATLLEVQRIASVFPMALPHNTSESFELGEYTVPKDALLLPFLYGVHHDVTSWPEPHDFRPERWLDGEGRVDSMKKSFMPFSLGRRKCLGEQLAKMEIFIFTVTLLQHFRFDRCAADELPSLEGNQGVTLAAKPFRVKLERT